MKPIIGAIIVLVFASIVSAQWIKQSVDTKASLRGLSVVNDEIIWASGTDGTVLKTTDGGKTWNVITVPGAERLDFRDIEAFDANTAYILSIGNGSLSRIYKTADGGKSWNLLFSNADERAFFDAIACWDRRHCIALSDPVDGHFLLIKTNDGETWQRVPVDKMLAAADGEAAFAASGTCLYINRHSGNLYIVTGGGNARVLLSTDRGDHWSVSATPIRSSIPGRGIFSISFADKRFGVIAGGDFQNPDDADGNLAFTRDGGRTWLAGKGLGGYRSAITYVSPKTIVAVGTNGADISYDGGLTWQKIGSEILNAVASSGKKSIWAVGPGGRVLKLALK